MDKIGTLYGFGYKGLSSTPIETEKDVIVDVLCTLEELYNGAQKTVSYNRQILGKTRITCRPETVE